ncbi:MAG: sugar ABC transporter substrate-binding protein [Armatimonadota bacterium]
MTYARFFKSLAVLALPALLLPVSGCKQKEAKKGPNPAVRGARVGLVLEDSGDYSKAVRSGAENLADRSGIELMVEDAKGRASEQSRAIEQLSQEEVRVILVSPVDGKKLDRAIDEARSKNVFVISLGEEIPGAGVASSIRFNQKSAGELAADYTGRHLENGTVAVLGEGGPEEKERRQAFEDYLREKFPSVKVVSPSGDAGTDPRAAAESLLRANPGVGAIFGLTDAVALGAVEAARGRSGGKKPFVISYGGSDAAIEELQKEDSPLQLVLGILPKRVGRVGVRQASRIVTNEKVRSVLFPVMPLTRDNYGMSPGWNGELPRDEAVQIPWETDLKLELVRE